MIIDRSSWSALHLTLYWTFELSLFLLFQWLTEFKNITNKVQDWWLYSIFHLYWLPNMVSPFHRTPRILIYIFEFMKLTNHWNVNKRDPYIHCEIDYCMFFLIPALAPMHIKLRDRVPLSQERGDREREEDCTYLEEWKPAYISNNHNLHFHRCAFLF